MLIAALLFLFLILGGAVAYAQTPPVTATEHITVGSDAIAGVINIVLKGGASRPNVSTKFGLSTGSFIGNRCGANGLNCVEGDKIDFSDGELFDIGGSWGLKGGPRQRDDRGGVSSSQPHQPRVVRSARSGRRG